MMNLTSVIKDQVAHTRKIQGSDELAAGGGGGVLFFVLPVRFTEANCCA